MYNYYPLSLYHGLESAARAIKAITVSIKYEEMKINNVKGLSDAFVLPGVVGYYPRVSLIVDPSLSSLWLVLKGVVAKVGKLAAIDGGIYDDNIISDAVSAINAISFSRLDYLPFGSALRAWQMSRDSLFSESTNLIKELV